MAGSTKGLGKIITCMGRVCTRGAMVDAMKVGRVIILRIIPHG